MAGERFFLLQKLKLSRNFELYMAIESHRDELFVIHMPFFKRVLKSMSDHVQKR